MIFNRISWLSLAIPGAVLAPAQTPSEPVAEVANIRFYSNELLNLHQTLYAAAWAGRTEGRVLAQKRPHPLTASFTAEERAIRDQAVHYYDAQIADRDPLSGRGTEKIKAALVSGKLDDPAIDKEPRATLEAAQPVFHRYFWPEQDRVNRAWIAAMTGRVETIAPEVIPRLEKIYETKWFSMPVRADAVWVGHWGQAYTSVNPPHSVLSSTDPGSPWWNSRDAAGRIWSESEAQGGSRRRSSATTRNKAIGVNPARPSGCGGARSQLCCISSPMSRVACVDASRWRPGGARNAAHGSSTTDCQGPGLVGGRVGVPRVFTCAQFQIAREARAGSGRFRPPTRESLARDSVLPHRRGRS